MISFIERRLFSWKKRFTFRLVGCDGKCTVSSPGVLVLSRAKMAMRTFHLLYFCPNLTVSVPLQSANACTVKNTKS
jgi:hypothetical protein